MGLVYFTISTFHLHAFSYTCLCLPLSTSLSLSKHLLVHPEHCRALSSTQTRARLTVQLQSNTTGSLKPHSKCKHLLLSLCPVEAPALGLTTVVLGWLLGHCLSAGTVSHATAPVPAGLPAPASPEAHGREGNREGKENERAFALL